MRPCSQGLREKIVRALEAGGTQEEVADRSPVSLSFAEGLWRRRPEAGGCAALPRAGGRQRALREHEAALREGVRAPARP